MTAAGTAGEIAGGIAGGAVGGAIGSLLFPPIGTFAGRWLGSRLGRMGGRALAETLSQDMIDADDAAEEDAAEEEDTDDCENCRTAECQELEDKINRRLHANKHRPTGEGSPPEDHHGLFPRRAEQICGARGPGTRGWSGHDTAIQNGQNGLRNDYDKYVKAGCMGHPDEDINWGQVQWAMHPAFRPSPSQWLGADHPSCRGVPQMIEQNRVREALEQIMNAPDPNGPRMY